MLGWLAGREDPPDAPVEEGRLRRHVAALADMSGRKPGTAGEQRATRYVAERFAELGLEPAGDRATWFQEFPIQTGGKGRNVLARLGFGSRSAVVVGAHVDHLGPGYPGADDNASGTAAMLEIARLLVERRYELRPTARRDVLFAAWSGEETGLLGSGHFVRFLESGVDVCLNLDMVGRLRDSLLLQGAGSSPAWPAEVERAAAPLGLSISLHSDPHLPTDSSSFYDKGIPVLSAFTGSHDDYHKPTDTPEKLHYPGSEKIARLMARIVESLVAREEPPAYVAVPRTAARSPGGVKITLGTRPDYGAGGPGLRLAGVTEGGPAAEAGLKAGDVVFELAGREILDIYGYTAALNDLRAGEPVKIRVRRGDQVLSFDITPRAR
jgi:hypothetical protein